MLKVAVAVFALVAVCYAQPPEPIKPPTIPETFMTDFMVHRRDHEGEYMGKGTWERNFMKGMARERAEFMNKNATFEEERLELFEEHMSYSILKNSTGTFCRKHDIPQNEMIRKMWDWVNSDEAHGDKHKDERTGKMVDRWSINMPQSFGRLQLFVDEKDLTVPIALIRESRGVEEDVRFTNFKAMEPPASDFVPPPACK